MGRKIFTAVLLILIFSITSNPSDPIALYLTFLNKEGGNWSIQFRDHSISSIYGIGKRTAPSATEAADRLVNEFHSMFGIDQSHDLRLTKIEKTDVGTHFFFQQYFAGLPVIGGQVLIHFDQKNRLIAATSGYKSLHGDISFFDDSYRKTITRLFGSGTLITNQGLWILPAKRKPQPVWRLQVEPSRIASGSWLVFVSASNPNIVLMAKRTFLSFEGEGNVWLENPVITPRRQIQTFTNMDATRSLSGKFVKVYNANSQKEAFPPLDLSDYTTAKQPNRKYNYDEKDLRLTEAMAYFHINRVHDRWSSFGFRGLDARAPVFVNAAVSDGGSGYDNALYQRSSRFPKTGIYVFGSGNKNENTGLDAEIYYHEYGHGVLDRMKPELLDSFESTYPASFHEAFGDISAAAISGNSKFADFGFRLKQTKQFQGRNMNNQKKFPRDVVWPVAGISEPHYTCLIATGAWWDLQKRIGALKAQRILYNGVRMLSDDMNFFDLKDSMLTADRSINRGVNGSVIEESFARHGLGGKNPGQKGSMSLQGLLTAALPPTANYTLKSTFSKGEMITIILEYNASNLTPGYWLVPVRFEIKGSGATPTSQFLISEIFNGLHQGLNGLYLAEIYTDESTASGTYTVTLQGRVGGTTKVLPAQMVTFTVN